MQHDQVYNQPHSSEMVTTVMKAAFYFRVTYSHVDLIHEVAFPFAVLYLQAVPINQTLG